MDVKKTQPIDCRTISDLAYPVKKMSAVHMFLLLAIAESATKPSIFFMLADDLGWNNLGWNNKEV